MTYKEKVQSDLRNPSQGNLTFTKEDKTRASVKKKKRMYYFTMLVTVVARVQHPVHTIIVMKTWDNQACESDVLCLAYCNILSPNLNNVHLQIQ